jgi:Zn-dependent protease with chaperone function
MKLTSRLFVILLMLSLSPEIISQTHTRDTVREQIIENELAKLDSTVLPIFRQATLAMDQYKLQLADSLYSVVLEKQPRFDPAIRRLGNISFELGKTEEGIKLCQEAVKINRSTYNLLTLALCLSQPGNYQNLNNALSLLEEAKKLPDGNDIDVISLMGQIQLEIGNVSDFRNTVELLKTDFPNQMVTHYYNAFLLAHDKKWLKAKEEIDEAKKNGLSEEAANAFLTSGVNTQLKIRNYAFSFLWVFLIWASGLLILFILGKLLSREVMKSIDDISKIDNLSNSIKSIYKWLINIGGIYYYFSLPIILVLIVALVVGLTYVFLLIGRIPIKLLLILLIGSAITIYSMVRSLMVKTKYVDPGRTLKEDEAPGLYALVQNVAQTLKTRPIDEIRITYGTDLAVYEKGSWRQKQQDTAKRILILGAAVASNFKNNDFRAVLAHEYGHFSHRDTAGGDVALKVREDMDKYIYALYAAGQNVWWNIAFQFLRLYNFLFRRISFGSTRLQEILADSVAASTFGAEAFKNGLTHVIRRDIEFSDLINQNVEEIRNAKPSINVYTNPELTNKYSDDLEKSLNCNTTEDDTHPSPKDRFKFVSKFDTTSSPVDNNPITDLLSDWPGIQKEMRDYIDNQISKSL